MHSNEATANPNPFQTGEASWYGAFHKGRKTSNGEIFDPTKNTCAHKTIPLGSVIRITNTENHQSAICRVNDHGPYRYHRVLDCSEKVATQLGFHDRGHAFVRIEIVQMAPVEYAMAPEKYARH